MDVQFKTILNLDRGNSLLGWIEDAGADLFQTQNWLNDHYCNGTTKETLYRRKEIDRKNKLETFLGPYGRKWDKYGECGKCGIESTLHCVNCPWQFYCCKDHQSQDWHQHKRTCKNVSWDETGKPVAGKNLKPGTELFEVSTIFVTTRFHTESELRDMDSEDLAKIIDGPMRPCFGCHVLIPPYLNSALLCSDCHFPVHSTACQVGDWHKDECHVLKRLHVEPWYDEIGNRDNIMIALAALRGLLLKKSQPHVWTEIMDLGLNVESDSDPGTLIPNIPKDLIVNFIKKECKMDLIEDEDITKFLSIFLKHRLNCCYPTSESKRLVGVICKGGLPFSLVKDEEANVMGGVYNYRMKMRFNTVKPVRKGELLTIGIGGS